MTGVGVSAAKMQRMGGFWIGYSGRGPRACRCRFGSGEKSDSASVPEFDAMEKDVEAPGNANLGKGL